MKPQSERKTRKRKDANAPQGEPPRAEIRARQGHGARVPIVALTAHGLEEDPEACRGAGMDGYLSKLTPLDELCRVVEGWARRGSAATLPGDGEPIPTAPAAGHTAAERVLDELAGKLPAEAVRRIADTFLDNVPPGLEALRLSIEVADGAAVARHAHSLRGACAVLRLERAAKLLAELEQTGANGGLDGAGNLLGEVNDELKPVLAFLAAGQERDRDAEQ